ncbi:MAG: hypothetical protein NT150_07115, partial [Bacteroidetes bacterium]|nr:hypothetical protein [Bacteroidota bacterium]
NKKTIRAIDPSFVRRTLPTHFPNVFSQVCPPDEGRIYHPYLKNFLIIAFVFISSFAKADTTFTFLPKGKVHLIGDQFEITATLKLPSNSKAVWPIFKDTITSKIEIIELAKKTSSTQKDFTTISQKIIVTCFDTGFIVIPPIEILNDSGKTIIASQAQLIEIKAIPTKGDEIKSIKEPLDTPFLWSEIKEELIYGSILLILIIALSVFLWWYFKKRKKPEIKIVLPQVSAKDAALQQLLDLENKKLWQQGKVKEYQSELTTILREYIEKKFDVIALELTTPEIIEQLSRRNLNSSEKEKLQRVLQIADMTKFAKAEPTPIENELCFSISKDFINSCG